MSNKAADLKKLGLSLAGLLAAKAVFFSMNPFLWSYFAAVYIEKKYRGLLFLCAVLGTAAALSPAGIVENVLILSLLSFVLYRLEKEGKKLSPYAAGTVAAIAALTSAFLNPPFQQGGWTSVLLAVMEALLAFAMTQLFHIAAAWLLNSRPAKAPGNEELLSMAILCAVLLFGLGNIKMPGFSVTECIVYFLILYMGYRYGAGAGTVTGAALGVVEGILLGSPGVTGIFCLLGVCAGMFREIGRFAACLAFVILHVVLGFFYAPALLEASFIRGLVSAAVVLCLIPGRYLYRVYSGGAAVKETPAKEGMDNFTKRRLREFSDTFRHLSRTFLSLSGTREALSRQDVEEILGGLSGQLCGSCEKCGRCTLRDMGEGLKAAGTVYQAARERGSVLAEDFPGGYPQKCVRFDTFLYETNRELAVASLNLNWHNRMAESREAVAGQLNEVAGMLSEFTRELSDTRELDSAMGTTIAQALRVHHMDVKDISIVENRKNKQEIYMTVKMGRGRCVTAREAAGLVGGIFGKRMRPSGDTKNIISREFDRLVLVEDTGFHVLTGIARKCREGEEVNGDNYSILDLENGETVMMLSDGMGFGAGACEESGTVIELLEQFLEAGFSEKAAIRLINSILVMRSGQQTFSTLDMGVIDLYSGRLRFLKIGAAASFIRHKDEVELIEACGLPVGILNRLEIEERSVQLFDGDFVIMVSDGILDSLAEGGPEEYLARYLKETAARNPQELAEGILREAAGKGAHPAADDMTVLVAGFWKK